MKSWIWICWYCLHSFTSPFIISYWWFWETYSLFKFCYCEQWENCNGGLIDYQSIDFLTSSRHDSRIMGRENTMWKEISTSRACCFNDRFLLLYVIWCVVARWSVQEYLQGNPLWLQYVKTPLLTLGYESSYDVFVKAHGGGLSGQAQAISLGIARALLKVSASHRLPLKQEGLLTRDSRVVERKKPGLRKARKRPQFSKR